MARRIDEAIAIGARSCDVLSLGENFSEVLAKSTGRARHRALQSVGRQLAAKRIGHGLQVRRRYIESGRNFSDRDSRLADEGRLEPGQRFRGDKLDKYLTRRRGVRRSVYSLPPIGRAFCEFFGGCCCLTGACAERYLRCTAPIELQHG